MTGNGDLKKVSGIFENLISLVLDAMFVYQVVSGPTSLASSGVQNFATNATSHLVTSFLSHVVPNEGFLDPNRAKWKTTSGPWNKQGRDAINIDIFIERVQIQK